MFKFLLIFTIITNFLYASSDDSAKFIVLDNETYDKIEIVNLLNGGISKKYLISSSRISQDNLKIYYPEYYLFNGEKCNIINDIIIGKKDIKINVSKINDIKKIQKELKKIRLLQILVDSEVSQKVVGNIEPKAIKSLGFICSNSVVYKNKIFNLEDQIGNFKIKNIDLANNVIRLEVK